MTATTEFQAPAMSRARLFDHALDAYLGLALGDALGATVEFMTRHEIAQRHGRHTEMTGGGWLKLAPGQVTDDTTMSLALGDALLAGQHRGRPFDAHLIADGFVAWWRAKPVDCGNTCRRGIVRYMTEGSVAGPFHEGDAGNGALMRNLPAALATLGRPDRLQRVSLTQAHVTHVHPLSDAAVLAFGEMLHTLLSVGEPGHAVQACRDIADRLVQAQPAFRFDPYPGRASGYVVDTVQTVLHHFFTARSAEEAILGAVNEGDDADTTGSLAGMLAGACWGAQQLPRRWLARLDRQVRAAITEQTSALLALALTS